MSLDQLLGLVPEGSNDWRSRVKPGIYTSPSGLPIEFTFVDLSRVTRKRTRVFDYSGVDDSYVQDNGIGARTYPIRCIFNGPNHDRLATSFEASLAERGPGELQHPLYGKFRAIPLGEFTRRNDLVESANESIVEVTFSTTLVDIYPAALGFPVNEILASIDGFDLSAADAFATLAELQTVARQANFKSALRASLATVRGAFDSVSGVTSEARRAIQDNENLLNEAVDTLIGTPLVLAQQILGFVAAPGRLISGLGSRLEGYGRMIDNMIAVYGPRDSDVGLLDKSRADLANSLRLADLILLAGSTNMSRAAVEERASSRSSALSSALTILERLDDVTAWRDARMGSLVLSDPPQPYADALDAASRAAGYLVQNSYSLLPERRLALDRPRNFVELCAELYGSVSNETLDRFIADNDLGGDEFFEFQRGRVVVYYTQAAA